MNQEIEQVAALYQIMVEFLVNYSFQIVGAIVIMVIGIMVGRKAGSLVKKLCRKHEIDPTLSHFVAAFVRIAIIVMVAIMALSKVGISVTPLLAIVGALSLGAGFAVQGLVANYGAGLNIIISRRFVVGDTIEINEVKGVVTEVHLGFTLLKDEDGIELLVPNRHIVGEVLKNAKSGSLVESIIRVSYDQSPQQTIEIIRQVLEQSNEVSQDRKINVGIQEFGESAIQLGVRFWVPTASYFEYRYLVNLAVFEALHQAGITMPMPQREVHLFEQSK